MRRRGVARPSFTNSRVFRRGVWVGFAGLALMFSACVTGLSRSDLANDYYDLGNAYAEIGKDAKALEYYGKAISLKPDLVRASYNLARIYLKQGKVAEALKIVDGLLKKDPRNSMVLETRGYALYLLDRKEEAKAAYDAALAIDPMSMSILNNLAVVEHALKEFDKALDHIRTAHQLAPDNSDILLRAGKYAVDAGKNSEAIGYYESYVKAKPKDKAVLVTLGDLYRSERSYDSAIQTYAAALQIAGDASVLFKKAAIELTAAEDPTNGLADLEGALKGGFKDEKEIEALLNEKSLTSRSDVVALLSKYKVGPGTAGAKSDNAAPGAGDPAKK